MKPYKARAIDIGMSFLDANITSFSRLAFISSYQPGQADDTPLVTAANRVAGRDLEPGEMAAVRHAVRGTSGHSGASAAAIS